MMDDDWVVVENGWVDLGATLTSPESSTRGRAGSSIPELEEHLTCSLARAQERIKQLEETDQKHRCREAELEALLIEAQENSLRHRLCAMEAEKRAENLVKEIEGARNTISSLWQIITGLESKIMDLVKESIKNEGAIETLGAEKKEVEHQVARLVNENKELKDLNNDLAKQIEQLSKKDCAFQVQAEISSMQEDEGSELIRKERCLKPDQCTQSEAVTTAPEMHLIAPLDIRSAANVLEIASAPSKQMAVTTEVEKKQQKRKGDKSWQPQREKINGKKTWKANNHRSHNIASQRKI